MLTLISYWIFRIAPLFFILLGYSLLLVVLFVDINMWEWRIAQIGVGSFCVLFILVSYELALSMDRRDY